MFLKTSSEVIVNNLFSLSFNEVIIDLLTQVHKLTKKATHSSMKVCVEDIDIHDLALERI